MKPYMNCQSQKEKVGLNLSVQDEIHNKTSHLREQIRWHEGNIERLKKLPRNDSNREKKLLLGRHHFVKALHKKCVSQKGNRKLYEQIGEEHVQDENDRDWFLANWRISGDVRYLALYAKSGCPDNEAAEKIFEAVIASEKTPASRHRHDGKEDANFAYRLDDWMKQANERSKEPVTKQDAYEAFEEKEGKKSHSYRDADQRIKKKLEKYLKN